MPANAHHQLFGLARAGLINLCDSLDAMNPSLFLVFFAHEGVSTQEPAALRPIVGPSPQYRKPRRKLCIIV